MGFWARLLGREVDDTVARHQEEVAQRQAEAARAQAIAAEGPFRLTIEDVFTITGRGTVVTGHVESGRVSVGDVVTWMDAAGQTRTAPVTGLEAFRSKLESASTGEHVGLLLGEVSRHDLQQGAVLSRG